MIGTCCEVCGDVVRYEPGHTALGHVHYDEQGCVQGQADRQVLALARSKMAYISSPVATAFYDDDTTSPQIGKATNSYPKRGRTAESGSVIRIAPDDDHISSAEVLKQLRKELARLRAS